MRGDATQAVPTRRSAEARHGGVGGTHALAAHYLRLGGWDTGGISAAQMDEAERWTLAQSKWTATGAWRAKLYNGSLWVRMLRMEPHWAERTSVLRLVLAAVLQRPQMPAFDVIYMHNDRDPAPRLSRARASVRSLHTSAASSTNWPLLTNAHEAGRSSIPLPDYSFVGWHTHTQPWCTLAREMQDGAAAAGPWDNRTDLAFFSGNLRIGSQRKQLRRLSLNRSAAAGALVVRDVGSTFYLPGGAAQRGSAAPLPLPHACRYKYLISVPGFGYSNRLKALLSCGSVVIHVRTAWDEFFMPQLQPERHLVVVPSVDAIVPAVLRLRANPGLARRIARAGGHFARQLTFGRVLGYVQDALGAVGRASRPMRPPDANYTRIAAPRDLARLAQLCDCAPPRQGAPPKLPGPAKPPTPSRQRCGAQLGFDAQRESQRRQPRASLERLTALRCCEGWDCSVSVCEADQADQVVPSRHLLTRGVGEYT